jgi:hypothetical protein
MPDTIMELVFLRTNAESTFINTWMDFRVENKCCSFWNSKSCIEYGDVNWASGILVKLPFRGQPYPAYRMIAPQLYLWRSNKFLVMLLHPSNHFVPFLFHWQAFRTNPVALKVAIFKRTICYSLKTFPMLKPTFI